MELINTELGVNLAGIGAAIGIGLLIGVERERRHGDGPLKAPAGIRTFTLTSLFGALSISLGLPVLITAFVLVGLLAIAGYLRSTEKNLGITSEIALITTFLLGAFAMRDTLVATGIAVVVTILLAARSRIHHFVRKTIDEQELRDALLLAAAALVILPLTPDRAVGPYEVLNPRTLWTLAVTVMAINSLGYVALRAFGPQFGLSFGGFAGGFVSSTATIGAMGARARDSAGSSRAAVSGAVLSSVATVLQLVVVIGATSMAALRAMAIPLLLSGLTALAYGALFAWHAAQKTKGEPIAKGRAFDPRVAIVFSLTIAAVTLLAAALTERYGALGLVVAATVSGLADAHAPAVAVASVTANGQIPVADCVIPIMLALTTNALTKCVVAVTAGGVSFAAKVIPGVVLMILAGWLGVLATRVI